MLLIDRVIICYDCNVIFLASSLKKHLLTSFLLYFIIILFSLFSERQRETILVHYFSVLVLSDECDESDELLVTVISIQCCVCTRL